MEAQILSTLSPYQKRKLLKEKRSTIRTFLCFAIMGGAREFISRMDEIPSIPRNNIEADRLIDFFNYPEKYPKDKYPSFTSIARNTPVSQEQNERNECSTPTGRDTGGSAGSTCS